MDDEFNVTYITLGGHVEFYKYRYLYFVIMFTVYILIICGNFTIVCLIWIHKNLHEPMYIFIAALLLNSVLFTTTFYPKMLIDFLSEKQIISYPACLFQFFVFYTLASSEFLLLSAMAYDRYVSICKPLQYHTVMRKTNIRIFLLLSWLLPACLLAGSAALNANQTLCTFTLQTIFCNNSIYKLHCIRSKAVSAYGIVLLLKLTVFPVFFIGFTYTRILIVAQQSSNEVRKKAAETCLPHLLVLFSFSFLVTYNVVIVRLEANIPKSASLIMNLQVVVYHPLFNPLIYGVKMKEISKCLKRLFCQSKMN